VKREKEKKPPQSFQQGAKTVSVFCGLILSVVACCAPATTSSTSRATAFTATFLGLSPDGQYLLAKSERSNTDVQMVYEPPLSLAVGQRIYVVGRLEGDVVQVAELNPLN
jgi:hypothetical protein